MKNLPVLPPVGKNPVQPKPTATRLRRYNVETKAHGTFALDQGENGRKLALVGRLAETLFELAQAGSRGLTERGADWAWHLPNYVAQLRSKGVSISTTMEPHLGGFHARYRLETPTNVMSYQPAQYGR
jgi:hypothetical protein